jgi:cell division protein FtsN
MRFTSIILALSLLVFVSCKDISDKLSNKKTEKVLNEEPEVYANEKEVVEEEPEVVIDTPKVTTAEEIKTDLNKDVILPGKFYIIGGSFKTYQKAQELHSQLTKKGYSETQILDPVNNFSRVVISSFNTEAGARAELKKLRAQYKDETIWLLTPKK